jgi:chloramphenicol-sensitive protein RarD
MTTAAAPADAPAADAAARARAGVVYSVGAYTIWGLLPLYLRLVKSVPPLELLTHRVIWSVVLVLATLGLRRRWGWVPGVLRSPRVMAGFAASATALSLNWFLYVWSVSVDRVVDASLGYFINPLFSIALGAVVLKERLSPARRAGVALASLGVLWLTIQLHQVPWIGLGLAASFGCYGLLRKTARLGALEGLAMETMLLLPAAVIVLGWIVAHGQSRFVAAGTGTRLLVVLAGPLTALPLALFAAGARRIPLSLVGLLQYVGPTLQLAVGVLVAHEPFGGKKLAGYGLIWAGFAVASAEGLRAAISPTSRA